MKKVIICAGALMFGAVTFGQQTNPSASSATPLAGSPANANVVETNQWGTDQRVKVHQVGESNSAKATQYNQLGSYDNNEAYIRQSGPTGFFGDYADDNVAESKQRGYQNETAIIQSGDRNNALSKQGIGTSGVAERNRSLIVQGGDDSGISDQSEDNFATTIQAGDYNSSIIRQDDDNNEADVDQNGDHNKVEINQDSYTPFSEADGHYADVDQDGDHNEALVEQDGYGGSNEAFTTQDGAYNDAYQSQNNNNGSGAMTNVATIEQINSYNADAYQLQVGEGNNALIEQTGGEFYPDYDSNYAEQKQYGDGNEASIDQTFTYAGVFESASDNYAKQYQKGDNNEASLTQTGNSNKSRQIQYGDDNMVTSVQDGEDNKLNTWQFGDDNHAMSTQLGIGNHALMVQHDGQSGEVYQSGHGNSADIFQAGPFGGAAQSCGFDDPLNIPSPDHAPSIDVQDPCADGDC
ncbi:hypothetical protein [Christiangramia sp. LLG6405-1]|uniref:hypothetical protein n=1 Tax=Christiangramia sp. LLG6405-1 TaxID=3160832 RepID=UPI003867B757